MNRQKATIPTAPAAAPARQIVCKDVTLGYGSQAVASRIAFEVRAGDYLCMVEENGAANPLVKDFSGTERVISSKALPASGRRGFRRGAGGRCPARCGPEADIEPLDSAVKLFLPTIRYT